MFKCCPNAFKVSRISNETLVWLLKGKKCQIISIITENSGQTKVTIWLVMSVDWPLFSDPCWYWYISRYLLKRSNIIPVHNKIDKKIVNNYRLVSYLIIIGKILEKLLSNSIMNFLQENNLLDSSESDFRPNDSCSIN